MWKYLAVTALFVSLLGGNARADSGPTDVTPTTPAEDAFVAGIRDDLTKRFPRATDAEAAGYVRYTAADNTGAISYANMHWNSEDAEHPSQLWYDKNGVLLGADFSRIKYGTNAPNLWGVNSGRWSEFDDHIHYVLEDPATHVRTYDLYLYVNKVPPGTFADPRHPTKDELVKLGKAKEASDVVALFDFPTIWDLIVWVKPNPKGAFADDNPALGPDKTWTGG